MPIPSMQQRDMVRFRRPYIEYRMPRLSRSYLDTIFHKSWRGKKSVLRLGFEPRTRQLTDYPLYQLSYRNNLLDGVDMK
jgi:hypothetical protein